MFFAALDPATGVELWSSDGTTAGTKLFKDINPGLDGASIGQLLVANNVLYFAAQDGVVGRELWKSDGTPAGTAMVKDIINGAASEIPPTSST